MQRSRLVGIGGLVALVAGCSADSGGPSPMPVASAVTQAGNNQSGMIGTVLPNPIRVKVLDQEGEPMPGVAVAFAVTAGGGAIPAPLDTTDAQGLASALWILGNEVGSGNNLATATISGYSGATPLFLASATPLASAYNIELRPLSPMSPTQAAAFASAAARWSGVIVGDLPADRVVAAAGDCFANSPPQDEVIDDVVIFATVDTIDGPGGILGSASPCWIRDVGSLTLVGGMVFDVEDLELLESLGILEAVILHEMGHVLGIGTLWDYMTPSLIVNAGSANPYFNGANGIFRFNLDGGVSYPGTPVPVENVGGPGTADGHWRESVMGKELMTGYISLTANPLSTITIGSLADMKYTVSYANADPYTVSPVNLRLGPGPAALPLREYRPGVVIKRRDASGRVIALR